MTSPTSWDRLERILDELLDLPEADRERRLDELGRHRPGDIRLLREAFDPGSDPPGIEEVGALLDAVGNAADDQRRAAEPDAPATVGPWRLIELIARGGMGDVYRAQRDDGEYHATAALKRLRIHLTSTTARDRFRLERQLLADLRHPNIATLLDGGVDTEGVPYFVMELVDGRPLTLHCDEACATVAERLAIFEQVTDAVAAAHRRLVVHRDLKPPNILVTRDGLAKLVDFGIAKLLDEPTDVSVTASHERFLTPRYAAPEQLLGGEITTATDVYGLGVILYELLSGCRTLTDDELQRALLVGGEIPDPPRMSAAVTGLAKDQANGLAVRRGTTRRGLVRELRGDLDEIVAKALRPDPADRYPTVAALADDIERARNLQPIEAHGRSLSYRLRKGWARHRVFATALTLVLVSLTVGLWVALAQADAARTAQLQAAAINRFLTEELLGSADPRVARGQAITVRDVVERTSRNLSATFVGEPEVEASIRRTLGGVWTRLGDFDSARAELEAADRLPVSDPAIHARLAIAFAELSFAEGRLASARSEADGAIAALTRSTGAHSLDTLRARILLGRIVDADADPIEAERVLTEVLALLDRHHPDEATARAEARLELAAVLRHQGRRIEALEHLDEGLDLQRQTLGDRHPDVATTLERQAENLSFMGWHDAAIDAARQSHEILAAAWGPVDWRSARGAYVLSKVLARAGRDDEALDLARSTLDTVLPVLGDEHEVIIELRNLLAHLARDRGDQAARTAYFRAALDGAERGLGVDQSATMMIRRNLSNHLAAIGDDEEAFELARQVRDFGLAAAAADRPDPMYLAKVSFFLSTSTLERARDFDAALALAERAVEVSDGRWYYPWVTLSEAHYRRGELDQAIEAERHALSLPDGLHYAGEERYLVRLYLEQGDPASAEVFLRDLLDRRREVRAPDDPLLGHTRAQLGRVLLAAGRPDQAETELRAALAQYDLRLDPDHQWRAPVLSDLGALVAAAGRPTEGRTLLLRARAIAAAADGSGRDELERIDRRLAEIDDRPVSDRDRAAAGASAARPGP